MLPSAATAADAPAERAVSEGRASEVSWEAIGCYPAVVGAQVFGVNLVAACTLLYLYVGWRVATLPGVARRVPRWFLIGVEWRCGRSFQRP